jgi:hypothetical protein
VQSVQGLSEDGWTGICMYVCVCVCMCMCYVLCVYVYVLCVLVCDYSYRHIDRQCFSTYLVGAGGVPAHSGGTSAVLGARLGHQRSIGVTLFAPFLLSFGYIRDVWLVAIRRAL